MMATTTTTTTHTAIGRGFTESSQSEHRPDTMADKGLAS